MITIGIKALNEGAKIARAIRSAQAAVAPFGGTVVLADSGSRDATVEIGRRAGITVVQLADTSERCCGAGAQLAFQYADADFFCLIDGDMELAPGFLDAAMAVLRDHPHVAGVGGQVTERNLSSQEFQIKAAAMANEEHRRAGLVDRLDGGGVYRIAAIRETGYFGDRNLHSFEEFDLAARLSAAGWQLMRVDAPSVFHDGHSGGHALIARRLRSGYLDGAGEVLRAALGREQLGYVLRHLGHLRWAAAIGAWWAALLAASLMEPATAPILLALPVLLLAWRRGGLALGVYSFLMWNATALGILRGIVRRRVDPRRPLAAVSYSPLD
ncbi:glycosyltransferase [Sphingomonas sp.]|uniref:glycosyltransferase n=1 Tax=Sphingomonas sp. TaxID=28214 RepID=UPI0035C79246